MNITQTKRKWKEILNVYKEKFLPQSIKEEIVFMLNEAGRYDKICNGVKDIIIKKNEVGNAYGFYIVNNTGNHIDFSIYKTIDILFGNDVSLRKFKAAMRNEEYKTRDVTARNGNHIDHVIYFDDILYDFCKSENIDYRNVVVKKR